MYYPQFEQLCLASLQSSMKKGIILHNGKLHMMAVHTKKVPFPPINIII